MVVHVFRLNGLLIALGDEMGEPSGQTSARWRVLAAIDEQPLSVAQIARAWWLTRQSVQRIADVLVEDGLAAYEDNPSHRRAKLVKITPRGLKALREIRLRQRTWAESLGERIGEADLREANVTLARVLDALTS
ncbi:MAG TPA: MarR family transcriptional regulator [Actinomycetota bacterium]|nr:MarR family transcriptional regulator [Actinomycetota bacterium]